MSDNSAPQVEKKEEETKAVVEEKKVEEVKEEKKAEEPAKEEKKEEEKKAEPKPASSASATDETPDVNTSEEYKTNEEGEDVLYGTRARLYRFDNVAKEWRERGTGNVKLLKHKETGRIRLLMRREKTFKICANHYVLPTMDLQVNKNNDKSWIWDCPADYSEDATKPSADVYAIRFNTADETKEFKAAWEKAQAEMKTLLSK